MGNKWKLLSKKAVFESKWMSIEDRLYKLPNGNESSYLHFNRPDYVLVVAVDKEQKIAVEKQYRRGVDDEVYELPAGWIESGEKPEQAAIRELQEETGLIGKGVWSQEIYAQPGFSSMKAFVVLVEIENIGLTKNDVDENIKYQMLSLPEIKKLVKLGQIKDMGFLSALEVYFSKN